MKREGEACWGAIFPNRILACFCKRAAQWTTQCSWHEIIFNLIEVYKKEFGSWRQMWQYFILVVTFTEFNPIDIYFIFFQLGLCMHITIHIQPIIASGGGINNTTCMLSIWIIPGSILNTSGSKTKSDSKDGKWLWLSKVTKIHWASYSSILSFT